MLSPEEQLEIGDRLREGDREAWSALYEHYNVVVWRLTARLVGPDLAGIADVVQEVFLAAASSARRFDSAKGTLGGWLAGIVHRQAANYWRKSERAQRWRTLLESGKVNPVDLLKSTESPSDLNDQTEIADLVRRVLAELPTDYAILLTAKYLDEHSLEELAAEHGGSVEATKSKLARARREFRAAFEILVGSVQGARLS